MVVDHHDAERRVRRHGVAAVVEDAADRGLRSRSALAVFILASMFLVIAGPTVAEQIARRMRPRVRVHVDVDGSCSGRSCFALVATAIAARLLLRARRRAGLGLDHARLGRRDRCLWLVVSLALKVYYQLMPNANAPTARSAASWC
jgi:hypothetical protein